MKIIKQLAFLNNLYYYNKVRKVTHEYEFQKL